MRFIPYEKLELTTGHSKDEIRRRLEAGVGKPRGGGFAALRKAEKLFEGDIREGDFLFWSAIRYNNGFMPLVSGSFEAGRITVELKWHPFIRWFFPLWFALLFALGFLAKFNCPQSAGSPF